LSAYIILALAIIAEVFGSSMIKLSDGFKKLYPTLGVLIGMGLGFYGIAIAIKTIPLGTAYAIWSGAGTALTAVVGTLFYKEKLDLKKVLGITVIIIK
jgi:multidrug resistance protein EbrA